MNQTSFTNNSSIYLKQKRLRHLNCLSAKSLQINSNRFNVWFTLHLTKNSRAFYISDKKENDRNPKWNLINLNKISLKEFIVRIWFSNLEDNLNKSSGTISVCRLNLLLEVDVNMDYLFSLNQSNFNYSIKNFTNFLVFEIFGINFCEPLFLNEKNRISKKINSINNMTTTTTTTSSSISKNDTNPKDLMIPFNIKNSYTLNLMIRLHDFQRVIHETQKKISHLKNNSLAKFDASSKLRQLQVKREEKIQRINLFKENLAKINQSIVYMKEFNSKLKESTIIYKKNLESLKFKLNSDKEKLIKVEKLIDLTLKSHLIFKNHLKLRQKQLINDLASVFKIEKVSISTNAEPSSLQTSNLNVKLSNMQILNVSVRLTNTNSQNVNNSNTSNIDRDSVALGYITQSIQILSNILCVPLRYPVQFRSSKSYIIEQIDDIDVRRYPLFKQNSAQDNLFLYAVNLLNANIIQIRFLFDNYKNIDYDDLLVNLKWIFDYFKI